MKWCGNGVVYSLLEHGDVREMYGMQRGGIHREQRMTNREEAAKATV